MSSLATSHRLSWSKKIHRISCSRPTSPLKKRLQNVKNPSLFRACKTPSPSKSRLRPLQPHSASLANVPRDSHLEERFRLQLRLKGIDPRVVLASSRLPVSSSSRTTVLQAWSNAVEAPSLLGTLDAFQFIERWETFDSNPDDPFSYFPTIVDHSPIPVPDSLMRMIPSKLKTRYEGTLAIGLLASPLWLSMGRFSKFEFLIDTLKALGRVGHWHGVREVVRYYLFFSRLQLRHRRLQYLRVMQAVQMSNIPLEAWKEVLPLFLEAMDRSVYTVPDVVFFEQLFKFQKLDYETMVSLLKEMDRRGLPVSRYIIRSNLTIYSRLGKSEECAQCLLLLSDERRKLVGDLAEVRQMRKSGKDPIKVWIAEGRTVTRDHCRYLASFHTNPKEGDEYLEYLEKFLEAKGRYDIKGHISSLLMQDTDLPEESRAMAFVWRVSLDLAARRATDYQEFISIFRELKGKYMAMRDSTSIMELNDNKTNMGHSITSMAFPLTGAMNMVRSGIWGVRRVSRNPIIVENFLLRILESEPWFSLDANMLAQLITVYVKNGQIELANTLVELLGKPVETENEGHLDDQEPISLPPVQGLVVPDEHKNESTSSPSGKLIDMLVAKFYKSVPLKTKVINHLMSGYKSDWGNAYRLWSTMERRWGTIPNDVTFTILTKAAMNAPYSSPIYGFDGSLPDAIALHKRNSQWHKPPQEFAHPTHFVADIFWRALYLNYPHLVQTIIVPTSAKPLDIIISEYIKYERFHGVPRNVWTPDGVARPLPSLSSAHPSEYPHITFNNALFLTVIRLFQATRSEDNIPLLLTWMRAIELDADVPTIGVALVTWMDGGKAGKMSVWAMWRWIKDWQGEQKAAKILEWMKRRDSFEKKNLVQALKDDTS